MLLLVDGDLIVYRVGFTTQEESSTVACFRANTLIETIVQRFNTDTVEVEVFLTAENDETSFRRLVYPEYKANRKAPKPLHYHVIRDYLEVDWNAKIVKKIEADDAMAISQINANSQGESSIICSIDKDLLQIPGEHYNFVKDELKTVSKIEGLKHFYTQMLVGDSADNIKGVPKIGPVKAGRILAGDLAEEEMFEIVRDQYQSGEEMDMNGQCLWIIRKPNEDWLTYRKKYDNKD